MILRVCMLKLHVHDYLLFFVTVYSVIYTLKVLGDYGSEATTGLAVVEK